MNKKINTLLSAVISVASAQASFDTDSYVFIAIDNVSGDTFVRDLGLTSELSTLQDNHINESISIPASFLSYGWTIVGASSGTQAVAGPPGGGFPPSSYQPYSVVPIHFKSLIDINY